MRIGIDIRNIGKGRTGDEVVFFNLVREMIRLDAETEFLLFLENRTETELQLLSDRLGASGKKNCSLVVLPARNKFDWNAWWVPQYLRTHVVDLYHTQYITPLFVPRRTKVITHIHDVSFFVYPEYIAPIDRLFLGMLMPRSLRRADRIVVPSIFTGKELVIRSGVPKEKIVTIENAVASEFFSEPSDIDRIARVRERYRIPEKFLLSVGTLQPRKNIPTLLEAFAAFRKNHTEIGLVLVGNRQGHHVDPKIDRVIERLDIGESVVFPGFVDQSDLLALFDAARIFVFPSYYEGFGIPLLEAMSRGVPVVASDIPALREAGGDAALFVPPNDAASFAEMFCRLIDSDSEREVLTRAGRRRALDFSWEKSARKLLALYREICFNGETLL